MVYIVASNANTRTILFFYLVYLLCILNSLIKKTNTNLISLDTDLQTLIASVSNINFFEPRASFLKNRSCPEITQGSISEEVFAMTIEIYISIAPHSNTPAEYTFYNRSRPLV